MKSRKDVFILYSVIYIIHLEGLFDKGRKEKNKGGEEGLFYGWKSTEMEWTALPTMWKQPCYGCPFQIFRSFVKGLKLIRLEVHLHIYAEHERTGIPNQFSRLPHKDASCGYWLSIYLASCLLPQ